jgi:hypothetical protein
MGHHRMGRSRPGRRPAGQYAGPRQEITGGLAITCVIGVAGAAVLLLAYHPVTGRAGRRMAPR